MSEGVVEDLLGSQARGICVLLTMGDEFLGQPLRFLCFVPGRLDGFVLDQGGDQVAEESLSVGGVAAEMPVFEVAVYHSDLQQFSQTR